jgi:hypothetical protein
MNYFAHGRRFIDNPYLLAGTATPDWLCVADRNVRVRAVRANEWVDDSDPQVAAMARGIMQHHHDDGWFHNSDAFNVLSWKLTVACREALPAEDGYRPSFLGHILVEILLDWALTRDEPELLERYYAAMQTVDPAAIERIVGRIAPQPPKRLAWFIERFCQERFLCDYADDAKLIFRLNQVMRRVQLSPLPDSFASVLTLGRELVAARSEELLQEGCVQVQK